MNIKRGEKSWAFFPLTYNILLTLWVGIISILPFNWVIKLICLLLISLFLFYLCFFNGWFRNKIVGIFMGSQQKIETFLK
jgi:hypothetical protein